MEPAAALADMPDAREFPGLAEAWQWSPNPRFHLAGALTADREHVVLVNALDSFDEALVRALLSFARERFAEVAEDSRALVPLPEFSAVGREFDTAAVIAPGAHPYFKEEEPGLHEATYAVFPAWHYEFSGDESEKEVAFQVAHPQGLDVTNLDREPCPFVRMSYRNTITQSRSRSKKRALAKADTLLRELALLESAPDSYVEYENFRGQVWRAGWEDTFVLTREGEEDRREMTRQELLDFARVSLT
ncbi:hypothetical protein [Phaeacidiphilus oryzae]|uniref:hypothetical protein n=1 Tax=Phaeacidiphilus oryzae TaxID=348818 RepID=UPI000562021E|nr:hypothetical protein [Phaeacidiphilus oryzae]